MKLLKHCFTEFEGEWKMIYKKAENYVKQQGVKEIQSILKLIEISEE